MINGLWPEWAYWRWHAIRYVYRKFVRGLQENEPISIPRYISVFWFDIQFIQSSDRITNTYLIILLSNDYTDN